MNEQVSNGAAYLLEPTRHEMLELSNRLVGRAIEFVERLPDAPASRSTGPANGASELDGLLAPPPEVGSEIGELLARIDVAAASGVETAGPGYLGWIPGGGLFTGAIGEFYAQVLNRYVALADIAPGLATLEHSVGRWLAQLCGMPPSAVGVLTSGGSLANFSAIVAARDTILGEDFARGTLYTTAYTHRSVAKAARLAGIPPANVRTVESTPELRMDPDAANDLIARDRAAGLRPFLIVGSAGTTDTGAIDPLPSVAELSRREGMWFHVDAAYGGFFTLTDRGAQRLAGVELADSITLDPHKSLFMPFGTGALVVRDAAALRTSHAVSGGYLQDLDPAREVPNFAELGPELTRECRGLRLWLPLHLHGLAAFREALDEKLDLAEVAYQRLSEEPTLELPWVPELTIVPFRIADAQSPSLNRVLLDEVNSRRRVFLTSTSIEERFTIRLCVLSHRTHRDRIEEALDEITSTARHIDTLAPSSGSTP